MKIATDGVYSMKIKISVENDAFKNNITKLKRQIISSQHYV